jgi:hypothetical protein
MCRREKPDASRGSAADGMSTRDDDGTGDPGSRTLTGADGRSVMACSRSLSGGAGAPRTEASSPSVIEPESFTPAWGLPRR